MKQAVPGGRGLHYCRAVLRARCGTLRPASQRNDTSTRIELARLPLARLAAAAPSTSQLARAYSSTSKNPHAAPTGATCISTTIDDERPDLFYHLYDPPNAVSSNIPVYALSFLKDPPSAPHSCAIIGWLPARAPGAPEGNADESAGLNDFVENDQFREVLHDAIRSGLRDGVDEDQKNAAIQTQEGWMHLHDMRNIPALGRIGDPDDIVGSVRVEDSKILAETYQPMPAYRLCTSDGVLQLTEGLRFRLLELLRQRVREESS